MIEQIPGWIDDYNTFAPHSSLGMETPAEFRRDQQTVAHRASHEIGVKAAALTRSARLKPSQPATISCSSLGSHENAGVFPAKRQARVVRRVQRS